MVFFFGSIQCGFRGSKSTVAFTPAPQQLAVDLGNLFQPIFQLVVVFYPAADLSHFFPGDDAAGWYAFVREIPVRAATPPRAHRHEGVSQVTYRSSSEPRRISAAGGSSLAKPCLR